MIRKLPWLFTLGLVLLGSIGALPAQAQVYNRFGPADGILVGDSATYQTTAAASSDVISLWTGTCNASTFLRADGSCAAALSGTVAVNQGGTGATSLSGVLKGNGTSPVTSAASSDVISLWTGTCNATSFLRGDGSCQTPASGVSSVGLTMPSGFSVTGSPVTSSGTLAVSTTLNGVLAGNGSGFTTASAANVYGLWSGTCDATTFLRGDGSCQAPPSGGTPGGSSTQMQYNNAGAFGGTAGLTWNSGTTTLANTGAITAGNSSLATSGLTVQGTAASAGQIRAQGSSAGATSISYVQFVDSAGTATGYVGDGSSGNSDIFLATSAANSNVNLLTSGTGSVMANSRPIVTATSGAVKVAYLRSSGIGSCNTSNSSGFSACSRSAAGTYNVTFAAGAFSSGTACTATSGDTSAVLAVTSVGGTTNVTVSTYAAIGAAAVDVSSFSLTCIGL